MLASIWLRLAALASLRLKLRSLRLAGEFRWFELKLASTSLLSDVNESDRVELCARARRRNCVLDKKNSNDAFVHWLLAVAAAAEEQIDAAAAALGLSSARELLWAVPH